MFKNVLEVKNLTKKFGDFTAVSNISFSLKEGEILGLLGPNGAGKTTTIQMLLNVMDPTSGEILYFGKNINHDTSGILSKINFSSAYISLPWLFTVEEILNVFANLYGINNKKKRIEKLINEFELTNLRKNSFGSLSAGERARLLLAKGFINYPSIILLDEPTASLDPDIAAKIREFLIKQRKDYGVSMLFTSHNMKEVEEMCDNVVFLNHGKIIAKDKPENLSNQIPESEIEILFKDIKMAENFFRKEKISFNKFKQSIQITIDTKNISELLTKISNNSLEYHDISINKPNLEDYFIKVSKGKTK
jgi:ABC-2 type transport system ATP-binding protein